MDQNNQRDGKVDRSGELDRLPPPMFPPGSRRRHVRSTPIGGSAAEGDFDEGGIPDDAFISPDEPIRRADEDEREFPSAAESILDEGAFIDLDAPIVRMGQPKPPEDFEEVLGAWGEHEDVVVTGIGDDAHLSDEDLHAIETFGDSHVADLFRALDRLTDEVRARGEEGLRVTTGMTRFEATLRAYCVGYLAGRREGG